MKRLLQRSHIDFADNNNKFEIVDEMTTGETKKAETFVAVLPFIIAPTVKLYRRNARKT